MKRIIVVVGGIVILMLVLWWGITWVANAGWPSSGPVEDTLPPHIRYVTPADGERVAESDGFCVHFYYQADKGMGDEPQKVIRYFIDGKNVTRGVIDLVTLQYGYPDPMGEPCYRRTEPLRPGWHTVKVAYVDIDGEHFEYLWRFQVISEQ